MTYTEAVHLIAAQHARTGLSNDDAENILWNHTAFPCSSPHHTFKQIAEYFTLGPVCDNCLGRGRL